MPVIPPGLETAVYEVIVAPPLLAGAVNGTEAVAVGIEKDAVPIVGAPGTVCIVIELLAADELLFPAALVANTVNV